jgi:octanoyl-[GcvH]:protein N-octanoyltransferase
VLEPLGASCTIGALPGEYCPGDFSLHHSDGPKIAGAAQRVISGAALYTAAILVEHGAGIRHALVDVYAALGLAWDPTTAGAITDVVPEMRASTVANALLRALPAGLADALPADVIADADRLRRRHTPRYEREKFEHA